MACERRYQGFVQYTGYIGLFFLMQERKFVAEFYQNETICFQSTCFLIAGSTICVQYMVVKKFRLLETATIASLVVQSPDLTMLFVASKWDLA